jgi:hypothetical protein
MADERGARGQISQHRSVDEGGIGANQQRASAATRCRRYGGRACELACHRATPPQGWRAAGFPARPSVGPAIEPGDGDVRVQTGDRPLNSRGTVAQRYTASRTRCGGPNRSAGQTQCARPLRGALLREGHTRLIEQRIPTSHHALPRVVFFSVAVGTLRRRRSRRFLSSTIHSTISPR